MKQKTLKKLAVRKETLVNLNFDGMAALRGGLSPTVTSCPPKCNTRYNCTYPCVTAIPYYCENSALCTEPC